MPEYTPISAAQYRLLDKYTAQELHRLNNKRDRLQDAKAIFAREGVPFDEKALNSAFEYIKQEETDAIDLKNKVEGNVTI